MAELSVGFFLFIWHETLGFFSLSLSIIVDKLSAFSLQGLPVSVSSLLPQTRVNVCSHLSIMNLTLSSAFSLQKSLKEIEMLMFLFKFTNSFNRSRSAVRPGSPLLARWQACFLGLLSGVRLSRAFPACLRLTWSASLGVTLFPFFPLAPACGVSPLTKPGFLW